MRLIVALLVLSSSLLVNGVEVLFNYPHLQCSGCMAITDFIGEKMNETAKQKNSIKVSSRKFQRQNEDGDGRWVDYESSELRAVEIIEDTCKNLGKYSLRHGPDGARQFSADHTLPSATFFGKKDREALEKPKLLETLCHEVMDELDEKLTPLIRKVRELDLLQDGFCRKATNLCGTKKVEKAMISDRKKKSIKEEKEKKKKAKAEAEREAAAAKAAAEAEASQAADPTPTPESDGEASAEEQRTDL